LVVILNTILGFDFGLKRIGVAVGNTLLKLAQPLQVICTTTSNARFSKISALIEEWHPSICVVGLPIYPDGAEHEMTIRCRRFANQLSGRYNIGTMLVDERYSSAVVPRRHGEIIDDQSAVIILQQYFDNQCQ